MVFQMAAFGKAAEKDLFGMLESERNIPVHLNMTLTRCCRHFESANGTMVRTAGHIMRLVAGPAPVAAGVARHQLPPPALPSTEELMGREELMKKPTRRKIAQLRRRLREIGALRLTDFARYPEPCRRMAEALLESV